MKQLLLPLLLCAPLAASGEGLATLVEDGKAGLELRYRYESVEQDDKPSTAGANTLRLRLHLATGSVDGFSAFAEFDRVQVIGGAHYDDTRNGLVNYPVVADPEGTDLNQAYLQFAGPRGTTARLGRQRIAFDNERFVGPVGWRQNEQTLDALRLETQALPRATVNYVYVGRVHRVFGPDEGTPPAELESDSHLLNVKVPLASAGTLVAYGYLLDFADAPQLSADTYGLRYDGSRGLSEGWKLGWTFEYAAQRDARYGLAELRVQGAAAGFMAGFELLSGERGTFTAAANPAFQTPLATLHPFQGWADKFLTTPSAGIEDRYAGASLKLRGWTGQATWHDFGAEATGADYGDELDVSVARRFAERYHLLLKFADYDADGFSSDTTKLWVQLTASF